MSAAASIAHAMLRVATAKEAAASVSLSHDAGCSCVACRTTAGERGALADMLVLLEDQEV